MGGQGLEAKGGQVSKVWEKEACLWEPGSAGKCTPQGWKGKEEQDGDWSLQLVTPRAASGSFVLNTHLSPGERDQSPGAALYSLRSWPSTFVGGHGGRYACRRTAQA